ncbi:MAG: TMEM143 family protein [Pseudomonadota bacterium]
MNRKNNIPCSRSDLLARLSASSRLNNTDQRHFREFGELLSALIHFQAHQQYERMKSNLALVDGHEQPQSGNNAPSPEHVANRLIDDFSEILTRANYFPIDEQEIHEALNKTSLIPVRTAVNFADFKLVRFFYRNKSPASVQIKKFFRQKELLVDTYDRMVVLLTTANTVEHQSSRNATSQVDELEPNRVYLNLYKNIPHGDLELLFPNIKISMTLKDKLLLVVPAVGAAVPMALKILPSLGLLVGLIAFVVFGYELTGTFKVDPENQKATYALFTAVLSIGLALGGFAAQQYLKYKSKRLSFLKKVADTLFFKTLDVGKGVISSVVDAAEEEQCKEILMTYFLLSCASSPINEQELDSAAEAWLSNEFDTNVDFKVGKALEEITTLTETSDDPGLIIRHEDDTYSVCDLVTAKERLDKIWDNAFPYSNQT